MSESGLFADCPECGGTAETATPLVPGIDTFRCPDCGARFQGGRQ